MLCFIRVGSSSPSLDPSSSRMAHSRSPSLLHDPRLAQIHSFALSYPLPPPGTPAHQVRGPSMLSASLVYGICSRSDPATGKVVKGYVDSLGSTDQQALFNPNHLFSAVTAILLAPLDPSIVLWAYQDGHIALTTLIVGGGRTPSKSLRSAPADGHEGAVWCLAGGVGGIMSGGEDGRMKLWLGGVGERREERLRLLWTGERTSLKPKGTAVAKVCWDAASGTAVGVTESGEVMVWVGLGSSSGAGASRSASGHATWRDEGVEKGSAQQSFGVALALDVVSSVKEGRPIVNVLVHLVGRPSFFKITFDFSTSSNQPIISSTTFSPSSASPSSADLTTFHTEFIVPPSPSFPLSSHVPTPSILSNGNSQSSPDSTPNVFYLPTSSSIEERIKTRGALGQSKFVVAGDSEGWLRIWEFDAGGGVVEPVREWRAGETKITALTSSEGLVLSGR
ncbi:hypothetical protein BDY24DRAFT_106550 [Mrakia frigida]|uniref:uncharacterized protein n=1 Tax=Mrakia frigida TaxID=29902 RepID=UPI003FCC12A0